MQNNFKNNYENAKKLIQKVEKKKFKHLTQLAKTKTL